jgi:hypothetical protein
MAATASNTELPSTAVSSSWPAWGRTFVMISSCPRYDIPDLLRVPSPSSCGRVLTTKGSADTVWVLLTLRFARCSSPLDPGSKCYVGCVLMQSLDCCNSWHSHSSITAPTHDGRLHHNTPFDSSTPMKCNSNSQILTRYSLHGISF